MVAAVQDWLDYTATRLSPFSDTPQLDAQVLLAHVLQRPRTWLLAHSTSRLDQDRSAALEAYVRRLERGEPLPYITGHQEFFDLDFDLTPDVLIPRPETELLVGRAVAWLQAAPDRRTVADVGTGSGCIAVCLAAHVPGVRVLATDMSFTALKVASHNAQKNKVADRIDFLQCDILPQHIAGLSTDGYFDLVCANLPYIPSAQLHMLPVYAREPALALDGGTDGLDPFRTLFKLVPEWMSPGGRILLEVETTHGAAVLSLAYDAFVSAAIHLHQDLAEHDRLLEIQLPPS